MAPKFLRLSSYHYRKVMHWLGGFLWSIKSSSSAILWCIVDKTFGFAKWEDEISYSQFKKYTGAVPDTVKACVDELLQKGLIRRRPHGKSFIYAIAVPDDLFVENREKFSTNNQQSSLFFPQNSDTYPQTVETSIENIDTQIKDVTSKGNNWSKVVEILKTLADINDTAPAYAYQLTHLPRWAKRAFSLGMGWGDVWALWQACQRIGRNPIALFISRLEDDGAIPIAKAKKPPKPLPKKERERLTLVNECRSAAMIA